MLRRISHRWVLLLPFMIFGLGVGLSVQTENEVSAQFDRAQDHWRAGHYTQAIQAYREVYESFPESRFAILALWESATLNYLSSYDLEEAVDLFEKLLTNFPNDPMANRARAMLAEIHESALHDPNQALFYWQQLDRAEVEAALRRKALFRIGKVLFDLSRFEEARVALEKVCRAQPSDYLTQQASLRLGILYQLQSKYEESLPHFLEVLTINDCDDCRLQAQLGLIESYEFLDDLDSAVKTARGLDAGDYPPKQELLQRLQQKRHYYRSSAWNN